MKKHLIALLVFQALVFASPAFADGTYEGTIQTKDDLSSCPSGVHAVINLVGRVLTFHNSNSGFHFSTKVDENGHGEGATEHGTKYSFDVTGDKIKATFVSSVYVGGHRVECFTDLTAILQGPAATSAQGQH